MLACTNMSVWKILVKLIWNKYKDLSDCDTKSWRLSVSSTQPVWYKSHVCFPMSLHIRNFKKAISVTALDKQQNQHRGKRNRQNMYTQIRSIWSWRYWDISVLYVLFGLFLKNSKSLEGKQSQAGYQIATEISWNFKKGKSQWAQEYCISYHQKLNACLRKKNTTLLDSSIRTVGDYKEKPEPTQSRLWPGNCILRRSIRQHLTSR